MCVLWKALQGTVIVPLYKDKGDKIECKNYKPFVYNW